MQVVKTILFVKVFGDKIAEELQFGLKYYSRKKEQRGVDKILTCWSLLELEDCPWCSGDCSLCSCECLKILPCEDKFIFAKNSK
jgi:hypothetical protein